MGFIKVGIGITHHLGLFKLLNSGYNYFNAHCSAVNISVKFYLRGHFSRRKERDAHLFFFLLVLRMCSVMMYHTMVPWGRQMKKNQHRKLFEAKQANNCRHICFIIADNRKTKETETLPEWQGSHKRLMNTKSISMSQKHSHSTQYTVNPHYADHRASFP